MELMQRTLDTRKEWRAWWGSNPRPQPSQGCALIQLSYKRRMVPKERFELSHPFEYYALNVARLPFRHFGDTYRIIMAEADSVNGKRHTDV